MAEALVSSVDHLKQLLAGTQSVDHADLMQAITRVTAAERALNDELSPAEADTVAACVAEKCALLHQHGQQLRGRLRTLEDAVLLHRPRAQALERAQKGAVPVHELLRYAGFVRTTSFAPRGWQFGAPLAGFEYPYPQEEEIHRSGLWPSKSSLSAPAVASGGTAAGAAGATDNGAGASAVAPAASAQSGINVDFDSDSDSSSSSSDEGAGPANKRAKLE
eukprot:g337.t1